MDKLYAPLVAALEGTVTTPEQFTAEQLTNYGRIFHWTPRFIVSPASQKDVATTIAFCREHKLSLSNRGSAHSQSQLAINRNGVLLEMKSMDRMGPVDETRMTVDVEPGVVWRDLTHHLKRWGLVPRVLTNNLGVTVGGTLSMAGIGVASFKYGSQGDNVVEMDVVTGAGEVETCSPERNPELFWGAIAGLGQFGIITRARLQLRRMKPMSRTYYLLYDDLRVFLEDARRSMDSGRWDHLESWGAPCAQGTRPVAGKRQVFAKWFYPFHLTVEYDEGAPPDDRALLEGLRPYDNLYTDDCPTIDFLERMVPVFELWKKAGTWEFMHPWIECILPWETAADCIEQVLQDTPPGIQVGGHVLLWPAKGTTSRSKNFMVPPGDNLVGFGLLPAVPQRYWEEMRERFENVSRLMVMFGAKRYLSGWVNFTPEEWKEHYGTRWGEMVALKRRYDPDHILNPGFLPFEA
ncbi:MAG TPA: FAD-binding protein [Candidatus Polarisedimenticolaceae bacterium]|nr:FAD-binding protein [Candidatus Polarisedimenticolaceae bacterium]